jgi:uncharacterized membrane protein YbhN (UPF0104 family)
VSHEVEANGNQASLRDLSRPRTWRTLLRITIAVALLAAVVWYARPAAVLDALRAVDPAAFLLALAVAIASNIASAFRWAAIARAMGLRAPNAPLVGFYAQAMAASTVLPGAVLGGDVLRGYALHRLGNPLQEGALSVLVDRLSGLWVLCALSLVAVLGIAAASAVGAGVGPDPRGDALIWAVLVLALACAMPFLAARLRPGPARVGFFEQIGRRTKRIESALSHLRPALPRLLAMSVVVQVLSAAAFWLYGRSVGADIALPVALAAAAPIFVMAALPIGYGGFGTRELAAVVVLAVAGVPADAAAGTGLLYGIGALMQGVLGAVLFLHPTGAQEAQHPGRG